MNAKKDTFLVLGGEGFVGRHIVQRLQARGDLVSAFDTDQRHDDVPFYSGDICNRKDIDDALEQSGATCIIHCISPLSTKNRDNLTIYHTVNVVGTRNVIDAALAAGVQKLIYTSSSGVVFDGRDIVNGDETLPYPWKPLDPYTASKALAEQSVIAANGKGRLSTVAIRPCGLFGIGDRETIVGVYDSFRRGMSHIQLGNNRNLFDRTYVGNVALGHVLAIDKLSDPSVANQVAGQVFCISNDEPIPFWDFLNAMHEQLYKLFPDQPPRKKTVVIPRMFALLLAHIMAFVAWLRGKKEATFTPNNVTFATATMYFNCSKAKRILGYKPDIGVQEGLEKTMEWWKSEIDASRA